MGLHDHSNGQLPVLSAIVSGNVIELLIGHPLDEDIQPEPEDFSLALEVGADEVPLPLSIHSVHLQSSESARSRLQFVVEAAEPLLGYLTLQYQPKHCFMYSLKTDDSINCFSARLPIQVCNDLVEPASAVALAGAVPEAKDGQLDIGFVSEEESTGPVLALTAGVYIAEASEHHIDLLFNQTLVPQPLRSGEFSVEVNGVSVGVSRTYLHESVNRNQPTLRIDTPTQIPKHAGVVVTYKATSGGITLKDGSLVPHFCVQLSADIPEASVAGVNQPVPGSDKQQAVSEVGRASLVDIVLANRRIVLPVSGALLFIFIMSIFYFSHQDPSKRVEADADVQSSVVAEVAPEKQVAPTKQAEPVSNPVKKVADNTPLKNCKLTYPKGDRYVGQCNDNNRPHGQGQYTWVSGSVYTGQWLAGKREGFGTIDYSNGARYQGDWVANKKQGQGTYWGENGSRFEGEFQAGQFTANGVCYMPDGARLVGPCPVTSATN